MNATTSMTPNERLLCALLRGEAPPWECGDDAESTSEFLEAARYHGVVPLLDAAFANPASYDSWPDAIRSTCHLETLAQAMYELAHRAELARVFDALARSEIDSLLLKGTGLAYGCYPSPVLRPRDDTDLLVAPGSSVVASQILEALGYRRKTGPAGTYVGYQLTLEYADRLGAQHLLDLHWRISNVQSFAWLYSFDELARETVAVRTLHSRATRLGNANALLLNLLHRVGSNRFQYPGFGDRLIWHYDIKLLVEQMSSTEFDDFQRMAETKRVAAIAIEGLRECALRFGSPRLTELLQSLANGPWADFGANLLKAGRLEREWIELQAVPNLRSRLAYLAQRAVPAREKVRERFPEYATRSLAFLHARRVFEGLRTLVTKARN